MLPGRLRDAQSCEVAELDQFGRCGIFFLQAIECVMQGDQVVTIHRDGYGLNPVILTLHLAAMLDTSFPSRVFDQDPPHRFGSGTKKMAFAVPLHFVAAAGEPQEGLVNQRGRLKGLTGTLIR